MKYKMVVSIIVVVFLLIWVALPQKEEVNTNSNQNEIENKPEFTASDLGYDNEIISTYYRNLSGTVEKMDRPAEDIAYDYKLVFDSPLTNEADLDGTGTPLESAPIVIKGISNSQYEEFMQNKLKELVGQRVQIEGLLMWGYAESRQIEPINIIKVEPTNPVKSSKILIRGAGRAEYSPKGDRILYHKKGSDGLYDVYISDKNARNEFCITCSSENFKSSHVGNASWHPNGKFIAFQAEKNSYLSFPGVKKMTHPGMGLYNDIWIAQIDNQQFWKIRELPTKQNLLDTKPLSTVLHPHFSDDGKQISWGETPKNTIRGWANWRIIVADFQIESNAPKISNYRELQPQNINKQYYESDDFNKDGTTLLISANLEKDQPPIGMDIYKYNLETNSLERLTNSLNHWDEAAIYSSDYKKIVWISSDGYDFNAQSGEVWWLNGKADFWMMNADGSNKKQITFFNTEGTEDYQLVNGSRVIPAYIEWSPDGSSLLASISVMEPRGLVDIVVLLELEE